MNECHVDFSGMSDDAEPVTFCEWRVVKAARKEHVCVMCRQKIAAGESYRTVSSVFEGEFSYDKVCEACYEISREFEYHIIDGGLWDAMAEEWEQGAHIQACIQRVTSSAAKSKLAERWRRWKGINDLCASPTQEKPNGKQ